MASVIGLGCVGSALLESFKLNNITPIYGYDKFKDGGTDCFDNCMQCPIMFLCLPTNYDEYLKEYNITATRETLSKLRDFRYSGIVILKSTVEPGTTEELSKEFPTLPIFHNPEFLSTATALSDFHNQKHIVIGRGSSCDDNDLGILYKFYQKYYPQAEISVCSSIESESMKCFTNAYYAVKIQYFNELFLLCQHNHVNYDNVKELMLKNGWINPMHTTVPGSDGKLSYGGHCFPKDANALLQHMKKKGTPHAVLEGCVMERNRMRNEGNEDFKCDIQNGIKTIQYSPAER